MTLKWNSALLWNVSHANALNCNPFAWRRSVAFFLYLFPFKLKIKVIREEGAVEKFKKVMQGFLSGKYKVKNLQKRS